MNNELPVMLPWKAQLKTFDQPDGFTCDRWLHGVENYSHLAQKMLKPILVVICWVKLHSLDLIVEDEVDLDQSDLDRCGIFAWYLWCLGNQKETANVESMRVFPMGIHHNIVPIHPEFSAYSGAIFYGIMMAKFFQSFDSERPLASEFLGV